MSSQFNVHVYVQRLLSPARESIDTRHSRPLQSRAKQCEDLFTRLYTCCQAAGTTTGTALLGRPTNGALVLKQSLHGEGRMFQVMNHFGVQIYVCGLGTAEAERIIAYCHGERLPRRRGKLRKSPLSPLKKASTSSLLSRPSTKRRWTNGRWSIFLAFQRTLPTTLPCLPRNEFLYRVALEVYSPESSSVRR